MQVKHCCDCAYWNGEPVGFWSALPDNMNWAVKARIRCTHPKHFKQPKCNYRKACKYFEQKEVRAIIVKGRYPEDDTAPCHSERSEDGLLNDSEKSVNINLKI